MPGNCFEEHAKDHDERGILVKEGSERWRLRRVEGRKQARLRRKEPQLADPTDHVCSICSRPCKGHAGFAAHGFAAHGLAAHGLAAQACGLRINNTAGDTPQMPTLYIHVLLRRKSFLFCISQV